MRVGSGCFFPGVSPATFGSEPYLITLGNRVAIAWGARFITHDGIAWLMRDKQPDIDIVAPIVVGDNVIIGTNAVIMPGVTVGSNCVVGVGAVVTRDVPSGSIVAGVPARVIGSLEDHFAKVQKNAIGTALLSPEEKKRLLKKHFGVSP